MSVESIRIAKADARVRHGTKHSDEVLQAIAETRVLNAIIDRNERLRREQAESPDQA